jgi:hypothetical protein
MDVSYFQRMSYTEHRSRLIKNDTKRPDLLR